MGRREKHWDGKLYGQSIPLTLQRNVLLFHFLSHNKGNTSQSLWLWEAINDSWLLNNTGLDYTDPLIIGLFSINTGQSFPICSFASMDSSNCNGKQYFSIPNYRFLTAYSQSEMENTVLDLSCIWDPQMQKANCRVKIIGRFWPNSCFVQGSIVQNYQKLEIFAIFYINVKIVNTIWK